MKARQTLCAAQFWILSSQLAAGCLQGPSAADPSHVKSAQIQDLAGGIWTAAQSPRTPQITLQLTRPAPEASSGIFWVEGEADPHLRADLLTPPWKQSTVGRLVPFTLAAHPAGARVTADRALSPGTQHTLLVWTGGPHAHGFWSLSMRASASHLAGARFAASLPANGETNVSRTLTECLWQWDGALRPPLPTRVRFQHPNGRAETLAAHWFPCPLRHLAPGSCALVRLNAPLSAGWHTLRLTEAPHARSGERLDAPSIRFQVSHRAPRALSVAPLLCEPDERAVSMGCARTTKDEAVLRTALSRTALVTAQAGPYRRAAVVSSRATRLRLPLRGRQHIEWLANDLSGGRLADGLALTAETDLAPVSVLEVLATPLGNSAAREYVEVVNQGSSAVSLREYRVAATPLAQGQRVQGEPWLEPGARARLVGPGFDAEAFSELPASLPHWPLEGALRLKQGRGRGVFLRDALNRRVSQLALPQGAPGRCVQRGHAEQAQVGACRYPEAADP